MATKLLAIKILILKRNQAGPLFLELTRSSETIYPSLGDLPGGVFNNEQNEAPGIAMQRVLLKQLGISIAENNLFLVYEYPREYLYCTLVDDATKINIHSKEYSSFRWVPLDKVGESNLLPALKEIIEHCHEEIEQVLKSR